MKRLFLTIALLSAITVSFAQKSGPKNRVADHVIWIGIDGWGAYTFDECYNVDIPNLRALMAEGSWSKDVRTVMPSDSGPNWASMFCGAPPMLHGFCDNSNWQEAPVAYKNEHGMWPTIFHVVRQAWPEAEIGVQHEWSSIKYYVDSLDLNYLKRVAENEATVTPREAARYIKEKKPNFFYIHIDQLDHVGHSIGHRSGEYFATLKDVDRQIGEIIKAVKDAGIYDNSIIIVNSDHGGIGTGHGGKTLSEMQVPIIYCGKGVKKNHEVKDVIAQFDIAATIAKIFNIEMPSCWRAKSTEILK